MACRRSNCLPVLSGRLAYRVRRSSSREPGNQFSQARCWGATWQHPSGLFANINANYRSGYFQEIVDQPTTGYPVSDPREYQAWRAGELFGAFVVVSIVFNVQKPTQSFVDLDGRTRGAVTDPRIVGPSFEGRF